MRFPLQPLAQLELLSQALNDSGADLHSILAVLLDDLTAAVPSLTGLLIRTEIDGGETITIIAVEPAPVAASMLLPLHLISELPSPTEMVLYAGEAGAFTALAADARAAYGLDGQLQVDRHRPPPRADTGDAVVIDGAAQQSIINQAIGVLIAHGLPQEEARNELNARAAAADTPALEIAREVLRQLSE